MKDPLSKLYLTCIICMVLSMLSVLVILAVGHHSPTVGDALIIAFALAFEFLVLGMTVSILREKI